MQLSQSAHIAPLLAKNLKHKFLASRKFIQGHLQLTHKNS